MLCWCLYVQLDSLERNETELNTIMEKKLAHQLRDVTEATARLYGNDLQIAERLLSRLLTFETQQSGFGLTATQDAHFNEVKRRTNNSVNLNMLWNPSLPLCQLCFEQIEFLTKKYVTKRLLNIFK